jgi:hypothetical protein
MLTSPFGFLRGSAAVMASALSKTPVNGPARACLRQQPSHEFRCLYYPERHIFFDVNDFDETLPAL